MMMLVPLLGLMIIGAILAVEIRDLLSAVVAVGAVGFLLSIGFLMLGAPDLAITQLVVEVLCLVILIRATIGRGVETVSGNRALVGAIVSGALLLALLLATVAALATYPEFGQSVLDRFPDVPSLTYLRDGMAKTGVGNTVTAILLDFRAYDTLGEATVLFCAVIGVLAVLRPTARQKIHDHEPEGERPENDQ
jgi:multisubunit Na+/H+ antiporter MnhB subunit